MVIRLALKTMVNSFQTIIGVQAKPFHRNALVGRLGETTPKHVNVVGHQAKNGTSDPITKRDMS